MLYETELVTCVEYTRHLAIFEQAVRRVWGDDPSFGLGPLDGTIDGLDSELQPNSSPDANLMNPSIYRLSQLIFARPAHVQPFYKWDASRDLCVGMRVKLLRPHPLAPFTSQDRPRQWNRCSHDLDAADQFHVKEICSVCGGSLVLERTYCTVHDDTMLSRDNDLPPFRLRPIWDYSSSPDRPVPLIEPVPPRFTALRCAHLQRDVDSDSASSRAASPTPGEEDCQPCEPCDGLEEGMGAIELEGGVLV